MISFQSVKKAFGDVSVLEDISFDLAKGEKISLLGPGACGKSTVLKLLLGIERPQCGQIHLMGCDMVKASERQKQKILRNVGMAFQHGALFDYMTVAENLIFAMENMTDYDEKKMNENIDYLLETVKLPRTRNMHPYELSGGMQRRVGVARALTTGPDLAIFDEPTAGLDPVTSTIILNMINRLVDLNEGKSMLVATSSVEIAIRFAERIVLINDGCVAGDGSWKDLLINGSDWVKKFLGVRLVGIDIEYARELGLPQEFIDTQWGHQT